MTDQPVRLDPLSRTALVFLASMAGLTALKIGEDIFAPLTLALVAGIILAPLADRLETLRLPRAFVAAALPAAGLFGLFALVFALEPVLDRVVDQWPIIRWELRGLMNEFRGVFQNIDEVNQEVERALGAGAADVPAMRANLPSLTDALFVAPRIGAQTLIFLAALFFFLLTRDNIYTWLSRTLGKTMGPSVIIRRIRTAERLVSQYFLTILMINAGLGVAVALGLTVLGLPGAIAWGAVAALLNFVLYVGPATMTLSLLLAGVFVFDGAASLTPAAVYLSLNFIEAQFVTPSFVGKRIAVNPLLVFVSLVFWLWLWGPAGGVIAIPVLVTVLAMLNVFGPSAPHGKPEA
ncbi:transport protein [Rhodovulum sp. P5]|uniref:AI-2E family transporter n=1 Tax=Rhodovulum sp. P5 TaxID=1564506 RepID=UPI0009C3747C|nr:AI-2E family transporter [Rhodovulum sp. P5]ARE40214.1 transport protein [Rhodovulum sp. P5]